MFADSFGLGGAAIYSLLNKGTTITNNSICTDKTGTSALGNSSYGIQLRGDQNGTISNNLIIRSQHLWHLFTSNQQLRNER